MFCPRCGRPVGEAANFCGGCGLPKTEIIRINQEKAAQAPAPVAEPAAEVQPVDIAELNSTISQLEDDLSGFSPVTDYTTEEPADTTDVFTPSDFIRQEIAEEAKKTEASPYAGQSDYSLNAPARPQFDYNYTQTARTAPQPVAVAEDEREEPLSTVDFIWMMLISAIPVVGLFYIIWMAFIQKDSRTKQSYGRAVLIFDIFATLLAFVFMVGIFATQIAMFY